MAASFDVVSELDEPLVLSPTNVLPGHTVGIRTKPTRIYVQYTMPKAVWESDSGQAILTSLATGIEQMVSEGLAIGGAGAQEPDETGLIVDYIDFQVALRDASGVPLPQTTTVRVPLEWFVAGSDPFAFGLIGDAVALLQAAYDNLARTAAL